MRPYCTRPPKNCRECSLTCYRRDCQNNPVPLGFYNLGMEAEALKGWTPETLADALEVPLAQVGVQVDCTPQAVGGGLLINALVDNDTIAWLREEVKRLIDRVVVDGSMKQEIGMTWGEVIDGGILLFTRQNLPKEVLGLLRDKGAPIGRIRWVALLPTQYYEIPFERLPLSGESFGPGGITDWDFDQVDIRILIGYNEPGKEA